MSGGWEAFVTSGSKLARSAAELLERAAREPDRAHEALVPLAALEMDAAVIGVREVHALAAALRERLEQLHGRAPSEQAQQSLSSAVLALAEAFDELERPDSSGAHLDSERLERARLSLVQGLAITPPPRPAAPPPPRVPAEVEDDTRWVPTVDEDMVDPFLEECQERLEGLAERLVELERTPDDPELVRAIFRDLHTLKGSSAFVGLKRMTRLAHAAEDLVGMLRDGKRSADRPLIDALLATMDGLGAIVQRAASRRPIDVDVGPLLERLERPGHAAQAAPAQASAPRAQPDAGQKQTLRIDFEKLDVLLNLVGELVLAKGRLGMAFTGFASLGKELDAQRRNAVTSAVGRARSRTGPVRSEDVATELGRIQRGYEQIVGELDGAGQRLDFVASELRDQVMKLRMIPIGRTWSKYHRTVREIAHKLGKRVRLELVGAETELDKVLVEQLDDPFLHLVRNAIDHGVETPEAREAAGKPPEGLVRLWAGHRGNQVVIRIEDDGRGIDVDRVRLKAVENGLLDAQLAAHLSLEEAIDLIFRPGFSTAAALSDVSGRGVGMDVVRETIGRLKGTVAVTSNMGSGSRFEIRLPLTLAIVQVLLVRVGGETYALPVDVVERTVAAAPSRIRRAAGREVLLDGDVDVPLLRLREVLGAAPSPADPTADVPVVLVDSGGARYGLVCDGFVGRQEIVIKGLGTLLRRVPGAAGATLVGERCVIILDVPAVVELGSAGGSAASAGHLPVVERPDAPHVLVAEDSDVIRESIRRVLEGAGYRVTVARDGSEALALATERRFDLVSTDVVMPGIDGYELTRRLRRLPAYRDVPIVMVTSKEERIDRIRGFDAGVDAYLAKPTDGPELLKVVMRHLRPGTEPPPRR